MEGVMRNIKTTIKEKDGRMLLVMTQDIWGETLIEERDITEYFLKHNIVAGGKNIE